MQISHVGYQTRGFDVTNLYKLFSNLYEVNSGQKMSRFNSYTITTLLHESFRIFFLFFHQFKKQGRSSISVRHPALMCTDLMLVVEGDEDGHDEFNVQLLGC